MSRTVNGISFSSATNANPIVINVGLVESQYAQNTDLNGFHHVEYKYTPVGLGNGGIQDGVNELNAVTVYDTSASNTELDKAPPVIKAFMYNDYAGMAIDGYVDSVFVEFTEGTYSTSHLSANDLLVTNAGDFTGLTAGSDNTNYLGSPGTAGTLIYFSTGASVIDTFDDSGNFAISTQNSFQLIDSEGNINNTLGAQSQAIIGDIAEPWLLSFTSTTPDNTYGPGANINITATYSENLGTPSTLNVTLNNGSTTTLNNVSGATVSGNYTVGATGSGQDISDLTVYLIPSESVRDIYTYNYNGSANIQTISSVPSSPNNLGDTSNINVDTNAPFVTNVTPSDLFITDADISPGSFWFDIDYSENMNASSTPTVTILPSNSTLAFRASVSGWQDADTYRAVYDVNNGEDELTLSSISISGAADAVGNIQTVYNGGGESVLIDTKNPTIVSTYPANLANLILLNDNIIVTFSEPMNTGTVTQTSSPNPGGWSVSWIGGNTIATYTHTNFTFNTIYTEQITAGKDMNGNNLAAGAVPNPWTFTTKSAGGDDGTSSTPECQLIINNGNTQTSSLDVQLNILLLHGQASEMLVSNNNYFSGISWQAYNPTFDWKLENAAYGKKEVFVKLRNSSGFSSVTCSDSIDYVQTITKEQAPVCGNGIIEQNEACDDGNVINNDGCSSLCLKEQVQDIYQSNLGDPAPAGPLPEGISYGMLVSLEKPDAAKWLAMSETEKQVYYAVYFIDQDNRRHTFPNAITFYSWFGPFEGNQISAISASRLAAIPLGKNVTIRPGTYLIKVQSSPETYAVSPYGQIHWIQNEAAAKALYGNAWNTLVRDVDPSFFSDYTIGAFLDGKKHPTGAVIMHQGDPNKYYIENGLKRNISAQIFTNNKLRNEFVRQEISPSIQYGTGADWVNLPIETLMTIR